MKFIRSELIIFCFLLFYQKKKNCMSQSKKFLYDNHRLLWFTKNNETLVWFPCKIAEILNKYGIWQKVAKKMKNELWPRITEKTPILNLLFFHPMIDGPLANKIVKGFPVFLLCWFLGIFLLRALVVLGGFDPFAPLEGDPELYQIFYSNLDDLWWSSFVAS